MKKRITESTDLFADCFFAAGQLHPFTFEKASVPHTDRFFAGSFYKADGTQIANKEKPAMQNYNSSM